MVKNDRLFSKKQRLALAMHSNWRCSICGCHLPDNWHADHVTPFSKSGKTDVINGQATCPECNQKKGSKIMKIPKLRTWQDNVLLKAIDAFSQGQKLFLTHATPGGGKTIHALSVFDEARKELGLTHLIILAPSTMLQNQWIGEAKRHYGIELSDTMIYQGQPSFREFQGIVMTYQSMNNLTDHLRMFCKNHRTLVVADEIHHVSDGQSWGDSFRESFEPCSYILGLTGTPWGSNGKQIAYVTYDNDGYAKPDYSYSKPTAIADSVCRITSFMGQSADSPEYLYGKDTYGYESLQDARNKAEVPDVYRKTLSSIKHMMPIFEQANNELGNLRTVIKDAGGLLVAPSIEAAHLFQDYLYFETGHRYPIVHSKMDNPHKEIANFRDSHDRWLISVDMVTEGVDIKRLQICVFLSTKNTELFLRQVAGRIERVRDPDNVFDKGCSFYYTKGDVLDAIIAKMTDENQQGVKLKEEAEKVFLFMWCVVH